MAIGGRLRLGVAGGYTSSRLGIAARASSATVKSTHALAYGSAVLGPVAVRAGIGYAWTTNHVSRSVTFPGYGAALAAGYDGNVLHGFSEAALPLPLLGGTVAPFVGSETYRVHSNAFAENGGAAALAGQARTETFTAGLLGLRVQTPIVAGLSARATSAWHHTFGDLRPTASLRFAAGTVPFTVAGTALSRDAAALALDVTWTAANRVTLTAGYGGTIGDRRDDGNAHVGPAIGF